MRFLAIAMFFLPFLPGCTREEPVTEKPKYVTNWVGYDFSRLRPGDIIVKKGRGQLSQKIVDKLHEKVPLSHCGIVTRKGDSLYVIHSVAKELTGIDGVQEVEFNRFMTDCQKGYFYVVRFKDSTGQRCPFDRVARLYAEKHIPFDYKLDYTDSSSMYCSEFVYWCLLTSTGKGHFNTVPVGNAEALGFNSLLDTSVFKIVCKY